MVDYIYSYLYHFSPCIALVFIAGSGREGCYPLFFCAYPSEEWGEVRREPSVRFLEATREKRNRFGSLYRTIARNETVSAYCIVQSREMKSFRPIVSYNHEK